MKVLEMSSYDGRHTAVVRISAEDGNMDYQINFILNNDLKLELRSVGYKTSRQRNFTFIDWYKYFHKDPEKFHQDVKKHIPALAINLAFDHFVSQIKVRPWEEL